MLQISANETAYCLGSKIAPTGIEFETYVVRQPDMTPIVQVQIFKDREGRWVAWTGSLIRTSEQNLARKVAEARNAQQ